MHGGVTYYTCESIRHNIMTFCLTICTAPSSPPRDVRFISANSMSIQLSWQPPLPSNQNGIIQHYLIRVTEEETTRQFELMPTSTSVTVTDLHPYYTYSFTVSAVTVGQGPYSEEISLQTLEDGE